MAKPAIYWGTAAVVAAGVVLMHIGVDTWAPVRFPELQRPITDPAPLSRAAKFFMLGYLALSVGGAVGAVALIFRGLSARDQQRLEESRDELWLESLSPESRERILTERRGSAEREARARAILEAERQGQAQEERR
jgi:hypothetical protein